MSPLHAILLNLYQSSSHDLVNHGAKPIRGHSETRVFHSTIYQSCQTDQGLSLYTIHGWRNFFSQLLYMSWPVVLGVLAWMILGYQTNPDPLSDQSHLLYLLSRTNYWVALVGLWNSQKCSIQFLPGCDSLSKFQAQWNRCNQDDTWGSLFQCSAGDSNPLLEHNGILQTILQSV